MTTPIIHPINEKKPELPCWLFLPNAKHGWFRLSGGLPVDISGCGFTHWSPDSPLPPEVTPEQQKGETGWTQTPPTKQDWYWHWNGDDDCAPLPMSVLYSGTTGKCFVASGQLCIEHAIDCEEYGGWWKPIKTPMTPTQIEIASIKPFTPPPASGPSPAAMEAAKEILTTDLPSMSRFLTVGQCEDARAKHIAAIIDRKFPREEDGARLDALQANPSELRWDDEKKAWCFTWSAGPGHNYGLSSGDIRSVADIIVAARAALQDSREGK